jgi:hypothetical protein
MVQGMKMNSRNLQECSKEVERMNHLRWLGIKPMLLQHGNARVHTSAGTSAPIENMGFEVVPHPLPIAQIWQSDFWLFAALKKHLKVIHFTCDEEV